jgi:hypothetical protein
MDSAQIEANFSEWLDSHVKKKTAGPDVAARIVVVLAMLERLRELPDLSVDVHLSKNYQQLNEHNKYVKQALDRHSLISPLTEHGRRASNVAAWSTPLFDWLRNAGFDRLSTSKQHTLLDILAGVAAERTRLINEAEPLVIKFNKGSARAIVSDLLDQAQAKNRAKDVAEYLIGAKLQLLYGDSLIQPKNVNTPSEFGDFQVGNAAIEVTINAADSRHIDQVQRLLGNTTLEIWLIVRLSDRERWQNVVDATFGHLIGRIVVTDIETFLCHNVSERSAFEADATREMFCTLIEIYNTRWLPNAGGNGLRIISGDPDSIE